MYMLRVPVLQHRRDDRLFENMTQNVYVQPVASLKSLDEAGAISKYELHAALTQLGMSEEQEQINELLPMGYFADSIVHGGWFFCFDPNCFFFKGYLHFWRWVEIETDPAELLETHWNCQWWYCINVRQRGKQIDDLKTRLNTASTARRQVDSCFKSADISSSDVVGTDGAFDTGELRMSPLMSQEAKERYGFDERLEGRPVLESSAAKCFDFCKPLQMLEVEANGQYIWAKQDIWLSCSI